MTIPTLRRGGSVVPLRRNDNQLNGRIDPWNDFSTMDRIFDNFFRSPFFVVDRNGNSAQTTSDGQLELYQTDQELIAFVFAPGLEPSELDISATSDVLTIKGSRRVQLQVTDGIVSHTPWAGQATASGSFNISYSLPVEIDTNKVSATYKDGVLEVHMARHESAKPKQVKVQVNQP